MTSLVEIGPVVLKNMFKCHQGGGVVLVVERSPCMREIRVGTLKNLPCLMAMSAEERSNFLPFIGNGDVSK